jgi:hypothetical protein
MTQPSVEKRGRVLSVLREMTAVQAVPSGLTYVTGVSIVRSPATIRLSTASM